MMPSSGNGHNTSAKPIVVVMGVAGVGKSTVARLLAVRLDVPFAEGDDFHPPANIAKMSAGIPLDDADRAPWLQKIGQWTAERFASGTGGVITCSALKRRYRDTLRAGCHDTFFLELTGDRRLIEDRMSHRAGHFMPPALLDSQLATLEPLQPDERGAVLDVGPDPNRVADEAFRLVTADGRTASGAGGHDR